MPVFNLFFSNYKKYFAILKSNFQKNNKNKKMYTNNNENELNNGEDVWDIPISNSSPKTTPIPSSTNRLFQHALNDTFNSRDSSAKPSPMMTKFDQEEFEKQFSFVNFCLDSNKPPTATVLSMSSTQTIQQQGAFKESDFDEITILQSEFEKLLEKPADNRERDFFELHKIIGQYFALTKMQTNKLETQNNKLDAQMNAKVAEVEEENRKLKLQVKMQADVLLKMQLKSLESAKKDLETTTGFVEFKKSMEKELAEIWAKIANNEMGKEQLGEEEEEKERNEKQ